jgi:hypothetical protein
MQLRQLEALKALGDGRATKLIIPTNLSDSVSNLSLVGDVLDIGKGADASPKAVDAEMGKDVCCEEPIRSKVTKDFVYIALGIDENEDAKGLLNKIGAILVYGAGTCRGIVGPSIEANPNTYHGGVFVLPRMKVGVEVLHGATIKLVVNAGADLAEAWTAGNIATLMNALTFTPIDGSVVTGSSVKGFNTGTTN